MRRKQRHNRSSQESGWRAELCGHREEATRGSLQQRKKVPVVEESNMRKSRKHLACCCLWGLVGTMPRFVPLFRRAGIPIRTLLEHSQLPADVPPHRPVDEVTSYMGNQGFCRIFQVNIVRHLSGRPMDCCGVTGQMCSIFAYPPKERLCAAVPSAWLRALGKLSWMMGLLNTLFYIRSSWRWFI